MKKYRYLSLTYTYIYATKNTDKSLKMKINPYQILGVNPKSTPDEIKTAFRRLVLIHHPDRGGDAETFKKIEYSYDILSNPSKRREYEQQVNDEPITQLSETVHNIVGEFWDKLKGKNEQGKDK